MTTRKRQVTVVGLGRMGTAIAERLRESNADHDVRTWTRRQGGSPADAVAGADVVLLCLFDGSACRSVLDACVGSLSAGTTVVNIATVAPTEATALEALVADTGASYLHAPVMGSTPAAAAGQLMLLLGGKPDPVAESVLASLGETLVLGGAAEAAAMKLVANGVLGDSLGTLRRALTRAEVLGLPRDAVLDMLSRSALARLIDGKREVLDGRGSPAQAQFASGALAKDLRLLADALGSVPEVSDAIGVLMGAGVLHEQDDIVRLPAARPDLSWLADARLDVSPDVVADPAVLRPLHRYALTHATGDPSYLTDAFLPTAHVEGYRDGSFVSWDLDDFSARFTGEPAPDEQSRTRRVDRLDVHGSVATATMTLRHGTDLFTDVFVLVRTPSADWRIASKAYERRTAPTATRE